MVDVGAKRVTRRIAVASGSISMSKAAFRQLAEGSAHKGDVIAVARIAAIQAAKWASDLIPLAHPIALTRVSVDFDLQELRHAVTATARVETRGRTGVEMEALAAAAAGLLTIYDMLKAVDRAMTINDIRLDEKHGGKSGSYRRRGL
jgi:cyclic pyranopterin phosphate synthase